MAFSIAIRSPCGGALFALLFIYGCWFSAASAETTVGRWCDRSIPKMPIGDAVLRIVAKDDGSVVLIRAFKKSAPLIQKLTEKRGGVYAISDSEFHARVRIVPATGNLQFFDDEGFIREASRLDTTSTTSGCLR